MSLNVEITSIKLQKDLINLAGQDCFAVVDGNQIKTIGTNCDYGTCLEFIIEKLAQDPYKFRDKCDFTDFVDLYSYLFENCNDEEELKSLLSDCFEGEDMSDYGKR
ncbi:MAG: hypothetical protein HDR41_00675 [Lactobacillus sp.]|nr:hypothetical protein [Lactobacillus sp.]